MAEAETPKKRPAPRNIEEPDPSPSQMSFVYKKTPQRDLRLHVHHGKD